jgi:1,4-alpha-glucan branching enzyme
VESKPAMKRRPASKTPPPKLSPRGVPATTSGPPRAVHFTFQDPGATFVFLAGTFNDWHPSATSMIATGNGRWVKTLELEPGMYEYLFVVDGRWMADPGSAITVSNPFGGINCCVNVR